MLTEDPKYYCYSCHNELIFEVKLGHRDACPHCAVDLHCCKNCELYDEGAHNNCQEPMSDYVPDSEKANFCGFFKFIEGEREGAGEVEEAMSKLEDLFKKK